MDPRLKRPCWNCASHRFVETLSCERCPDCGIECNYAGSGANDLYRQASDRRHEEEERRLQEESDRSWEGFY